MVGWASMGRIIEYPIDKRLKGHTNTGKEAYKMNRESNHGNVRLPAVIVMLAAIAIAWTVMGQDARRVPLGQIEGLPPPWQTKVILDTTVPLTQSAEETDIANAYPFPLTPLPHPTLDMSPTQVARSAESIALIDLNAINSRYSRATPFPGLAELMYYTDVTSDQAATLEASIENRPDVPAVASIIRHPQTPAIYTLRVRNRLGLLEKEIDSLDYNKLRSLLP